MNETQPAANLAKPGMVRAWLLAGLYGAALVVPPTLAMLSEQGRDGAAPLYQAGRCFALTAFTILCLQVALTGRFKVVERPFGLDVLVRFHRRMALVAGALVLCHPVLLALGGAGTKLLTGLDLPWYIWAGKATGLLLLANLAASLFQNRLSLGFERWRVLHDLLGPGLLVLAFTHSWFVKKGFPDTPLATLWPLLAGSALFLTVWHRFIRPVLAAGRAFTVTAVRQEAPGVWTLEFKPPSGTPPFAYLPGQFQFVTLLRKRGLPVEEHHFTLSSSPTRPDAISSTIKERGDFTATIGRTAPGDRAVIQAPFGRFSYLLHPEDRDMVFLAGATVVPVNRKA